MGCFFINWIEEIWIEPRKRGLTTRTRRDGRIAGLPKAKVRLCGRGFEKAEGHPPYLHQFIKRHPSGCFFINWIEEIWIEPRKRGLTTRTRRDGRIAGLPKAKVRLCGRGFEKAEGHPPYLHQFIKRHPLGCFSFSPILLVILKKYATIKNYTDN